MNTTAQKQNEILAIKTTSFFKRNSKMRPPYMDLRSGPQISQKVYWIVKEFDKIKVIQRLKLGPHLKSIYMILIIEWLHSWNLLDHFLVNGLIVDPYATPKAQFIQLGPALNKSQPKFVLRVYIYSNTRDSLNYKR